MEPAAVLAVVVKARGVAATNTQLNTVQRTLVKTEAAGTAMGSSIQKSNKKLQAASTGMVSTGKAINRNIGLPLLAVTALSAKAAVDFEDSFADIRKTVNATEKQYAQMEIQVRNLAKHIPISVNELNRLGGEAGALGIRRKALIPFIKTAAELGTTTDLSANEAANALARLSNIMQTPEKDFRRLASTFVDLGNKGASTEQEIAGMSLRIAAAGTQVGLSESEVLSFASALSSVGVRAEAGGSSISKVFSMMDDAVKSGKPELETYGKVAGMSGEQFQKAFGNDAAGAMITFIEGLDRIRQNGGNVYAILAKLGLKDIRVRQSLLSAAGAGNLFNEQLRVGSVEWEQNNALTQEASKRYGTTASKIQLAKNRIVDVGIEMGQNLLPILADVLEMVSGVAHVFGMLPDGTQQTILKMIALTVVIGVLLTLGGKLVAAYMQIPKLLAWITGSTAASTAATEAQALANVQLAASLEAVMAAQRQQQVMASGRTVSWGSKAGTAATTVAQTEATVAGGGAARGLASGLARMLPFALAAVGVGNIISSVIGGDTNGAVYKTAGAGIGAAIGAGIGFGLPGALVGGGIGSLLGGVIGDIFSDSNTNDLTNFQEAVKSSSGEVSTALGHQKSAAEAVKNANRQLNTVGQHQKHVSKEIKAAEDKLAQVRSTHKAGAPAVRKAEESLAIWKRRNIRLTNQQKKSEQLHGIALWGFKNAAKAAVVKMKERIGLLDEEKRKSAEKLIKDKKEHVGLEQVEKDYRRWNRVSKELRNTHGTLGAKIKEVADVAGGKFAKHILHANTAVLKYGENLKNIERTAKRLAPGMTPMTEAIKRFGERGSKATGKVTRGVKDVKSAMAPFRTETHTQMTKAGGDIEQFKKTGVKGVEKVRSTLGGFAGELGIGSVQFGIKPKKGGKKQRGGPIVVPGGGTGDTVPLLAHVEPGEVIHVLNSRASKDRKKLAGLEMLNRSVPRFQSGGMFVDPMGPGTGIVNRAIADVVGRWSTKYNAAINYGYDPGGGHESPGHNITGTATDTGPAAGWTGPATSLFETGLRSILGKVDQILYGTAGIGEPWPGHGRGNHAHIEWGMHPDVQGALGSMIQKMEMTGPPGKLRDVGQAVLDAAVSMANKKLQQLGAMGGGPDLNLAGVNGPLESQAAEIAKAAHSPKRATLALYEALWAESSMGTTAPGNVLEALEPYTQIRPAAEEISGFLTGVPTWTGTAAIPLARSTDLPAHAIAQLVQKSGVGEGNEGRANYLPQKGAALESMARFGLQKGGMLTEAKKKAKEVPLNKSIKNILEMAGKGKHPPKYKAQLKKLHRRIDGVGLSGEQVGRLGDMSKEVEKFSEYASNASSLTLTDEDGNVTQGLFRGDTEGHWLNKQLNALLVLRRDVIRAHQAIQKNHVPRVHKLLMGAKSRLRVVRKAIREAEQQKQQIEAKIKEIERAQKNNKTDLEKEVKELEHSLTKAKGAKHPSHDLIEGIQGEIATRKDAISGSDKKSTSGIKKMREEITGIDKAQAARKRIEISLVSSPLGIVPSLESKQTSLMETAASLFGDGGEVGKVGFMGLQQIQGKGGLTTQIDGIPAIGQLGPEVLTVQQRLRELNEEATKLPGAAGPNAEELEEIAKQDALDWRRKFLVSQYQYKVLSQFPTVSEVANPFAGSFAKGGVLMAEVGERGREIVAAPQGARVVPKHEVNAALSGGGAPVVIEELIIHSDGTVEAKTAGGTSPAEVRKVTRQDVSRSMSRTPGGGGLK